MLESSRACLDETLSMIDFILSIYEDARKQYSSDPILGPCITAGWNKLKKYYALSDDSPAYSAAIVLNPSLKCEYTHETWEAA
jgi:hypothetical protein